MRIRVTTRAGLYERRKQEHIDRGYRIEEERPIPVNGFCTFVAVRDLPVSDALTELVAQAINGGHGARGDYCGARCRSKSAFDSMASAAFIRVMTPPAMDVRNRGDVKDVNLYT